MARLEKTTRDELPDRAFAYVDARGRRKLPIHDEAHVRNALARFGRVAFESDAARERARKRLLVAAKRYGIVPVGFITGQLVTEREAGERSARRPRQLPAGYVTMLMTDLEGSTALVRRLGDGYRELINEVRSLHREASVGSGGHVVESRADDFFAVFEDPAAAIAAALEITRRLRQRAAIGEPEVLVRVGVHSGSPTVNDGNYIGLPVHATARICAAAHGGQVLVSGETRQATRAAHPAGVRFRSLGSHRLRGLEAPVELFQLGAAGLPARFPPLRTG